MTSTTAATALPVRRTTSAVESLRMALGVSLGASAGIHVVLAPHHFTESATSGGMFILSSVAMVAVAIAAAVRPSRAIFQVAAALSAGTILVYGLALFGPVPLVASHAESLTAVGVLTKGIELVALVAAINLAALADIRPARRLALFAGAYPVVLAAIGGAYVARAIGMGGH